MAEADQGEKCTSANAAKPSPISSHRTGCRETARPHPLHCLLLVVRGLRGCSLSTVACSRDVRSPKCRVLYVADTATAAVHKRSITHNPLA